jgi:hypothetical protein
LNFISAKIYSSIYTKGEGIKYSPFIKIFLFFS